MSVLHLRLRGETVVALKQRSTQAGIAPSEYVELVLWYASLEWAEAKASDAPIPAGVDEELYFPAALSAGLREQMILQSAARVQNLAAYAGSLVEHFLARFERDPVDLRLIGRLGESLGGGEVLTELKFLEVLQSVAGTPVARMPPGYQARWLHQRFRPYLRQIESADGVAAELTVERIARLLGRLGQRGA